MKPSSTRWLSYRAIGGPWKNLIKVDKLINYLCIGCISIFQRGNVSFDSCHSHYFLIFLSFGNNFQKKLIFPPKMPLFWWRCTRSCNNVCQLWPLQFEAHIVTFHAPQYQLSGVHPPWPVLILPKLWKPSISRWFPDQRRVKLACWVLSCFVVGEWPRAQKKITITVITMDAAYKYWWHRILFENNYNIIKFS